MGTGGKGEKGRPSKRPRQMEETDDDSSSDDDDRILVDHLVEAGTNEEEALCVVCGNGACRPPLDPL
eukprot:2284371-Pyramimonas_sp.AAC.1